MTAITLEAIRARQSELDSMIQQFTAQGPEPTVLNLPALRIELRAGEHYAGAVLDESGQIRHHLVLMAERPAARLSWDGATEWASSVGGALPDRQEQALLFANCKPHLEGAWHWSSQEYEGDASYAWFCGFSYGYQYYYHKSYEGCAVAVRRL